MQKVFRNSYELGIKGESVALAFLNLQGYHILAKRYRTPYGEIDIIARYDTMIVCVEVKTRNTLKASLEALKVRQQERIMNAYLQFIQSFPDYANDAVRFDVIVCAPNAKPLHIKNAFGANHD
ncbi:MAG: YraN family protein [Alphaproteobacteria bacterium]|nr:YraN family protein [Alphaproteobacteria bacterium]